MAAAFDNRELETSGLSWDHGDRKEFIGTTENDIRQELGMDRRKVYPLKR